MNPTLRKAAVLITALDRRTADALLDQMGPEQAAVVRSAVMNLDVVDPVEQKAVIEEFRRSQSGGDAFSASPEATTLAPLDDHGRQAMAAPLAEKETRFQFLAGADAATTAGFLKHEHPQTIAIVMSHLPPRRASKVLLALPEEMRGEVLYRIANLSEIAPDVMSEVEQEMENLLAAEIEADQRRREGVNAVQAILDETGSSRTELMKTLSSRSETFRSLDVETNQPADDPNILPFPTASIDHDTAAEHQAGAGELHESDVQQSTPGPKAAEDMLTFAQVTTLDDASLALVFSRAEPRITKLALTGAPLPFVERIARQLPYEERSTFMRSMQKVGPFRLSDVEQAQQHLAEIATTLAKRNMVRAARAA